MEEQRNDANRPVNPRRRKRSQMQIFKEAYLPVVIAGAAVLLIIIFVIGSISRSVQIKNAEKAASLAASSSAQAEFDRLSEEADALIAQANALADLYDIPGAIAVLESFSGDAGLFPAIGTRIAELNEQLSNMTAWSDPAQVTSLSFQLLIADPARAFSNETYGTAYNRNFVTTGEFKDILEQLYNNGYILVGLDDIVTTQTTESGMQVYRPKTLFLPNGKKPLLLTQTNVNYNTYMIDGDGDRLPDRDGAGFASKLVIGPDGKITCEMVDSTGATVTGDYDLVPILDAFVEAHPDFSYRGAKAVLAVTGYDGLFGYRTNAEAEETFGSDVYAQEIEGAASIANALRNSGYEIACYTYENVPYGEYSEVQIQADLSGWTAEVLPILGNVDILAFAQNSDISDATPYTGTKYNTLYDAGFRFYLGFCTNGNAFASVSDDYVRLGRILVTGSNMAYHTDWFTGMFDTTTVLDSANRGDIPS